MIGLACPTIEGDAFVELITARLELDEEDICQRMSGAEHGTKIAVVRAQIATGNGCLQLIDV